MPSRKAMTPDNTSGAGLAVEPITEEMILGNLVREWQRAKAAEGCTKTTLKAYLNIGNQFCRWAGGPLGRRVTQDDFTAEMIQNFIVYLRTGREKPLNPNTIRGYLTHLSSFGDWLAESGWIAENPVHRVKKPRRVPAQRRLTNEREVLAMLAACDRLPDKRGEEPGRYSAKARAVLCLLAYGGLRSAEVRALKVEDVHLRQNYISVLGKGGKPRKVPLCDEAMNALRLWLRLRGELKRDWLFDSTPNRPMGQRTYYDLWRAVRAAAGLKEETDLNPHCFRHEVASRLDRRGVGLRGIGDFLGHSRTGTTDAYLHGSEEHLQEIRNLTEISRRGAAKPATAKLGDRPKAEPRFQRQDLTRRDERRRR